MKKKTLLVALIFAGSIAANCQTPEDEVEAMITLLGVQKKEAVAKLVYVPSKDSVSFWNIYNEYQQDNKKTATQRLQLYEKTALSYEKLTPESADSLASRYFQNRLKQEKSLEAYYKKMKKATNATLAFQFYQAEVYLLTLLRAQIMQQIPTYGELQLLYRSK
ncbi:MAG TPA: hypothetical protein VLC98_07820 [Phnomibacter sp.]|nr:hypothetical protein [Phnomibacter sp.]